MGCWVRSQARTERNKKMSWIEFVAAFFVLGAFIALVRRGVFNGILHVFYGLARIECRNPRLPPGVAKLTPAVVREPLEHVHCERWKAHSGKHEAKTGDGIERW